MRSSCAEPEGPALPAAVTEANKAEYLQLLVEHRLVGAIKEQIRAFRAGLAVFLTDEVCASHACVAQFCYTQR